MAKIFIKRFRVLSVRTFARQNSVTVMLNAENGDDRTSLYSISLTPALVKELEIKRGTSLVLQSRTQ